MKPILIHIILLFIPTVTRCTNIEARDEKTFPNGTLVGTYTYVDAQGNQVNVKYYADEKSYSIDLRGYKTSEDENYDTIRNSSVNGEPTSESLQDTMVPLKLDFPDIENIYTIENPPNVTDDIATNNEKNHHMNDNDNQLGDYDVYDSVSKTPKTKRHGKDKKMKYKKVIRKIRQTLDTLMKGVPNL